MGFEHCGITYDFILASDLPRYGMALELVASAKCIAEVFYADETGCLSVSLHEQGLPLPVVEKLIAAAKVRLPPVSSPASPAG